MTSIHHGSNNPGKKALYDLYAEQLLIKDEVSPPFSCGAIVDLCHGKTAGPGSTHHSDRSDEGGSDGKKELSEEEQREFLDDIYKPQYKVHGFDYDKMSLKMLLLDESRKDSFKLVGVVGMIGVGKTTLCRLILDEEEVKQRFFPRFWITMPGDKEPRSMEKVVERMLGCLGVEEEIINSISNAHKLPGLLYALHLHLKGKRYLILLDNVRVQDEYYEKLKSCLLDGHGFPKGYGGAVMVTSRDEEAVKKMVGEQSLHRLLPILDPDSFWPIYEKSDSAAQDSGSKVSKEVKEELINKCGGLPLAARILRKLKDLEMKQKDYLAAAAASEETSSQASKEGSIQASVTSNEASNQAPVASKEASNQASATSKEDLIEASTASKEVSNDASATSTEDSKQASTASNQASASKEVSSDTFVASNEDSNQASAPSKEGTIIQASTASNDDPNQASAPSKEGSIQASATSNEDTNQASAASSKEGSIQASTASQEVSSDATVSSKEGSNPAPTA